ncbi:MAG: ATP synthase F1 subunit epsilon [Myxococcales bacterium FL481]|nr:MAG: ATP synthase F1 subunit epsilon [Myxococcales bacterium FL481]
MANALLELDVLTPVGAVATVKVAGVEIPGALGELGVLPGHIPFVSPLRPGVVRYRDDQADIRMAVGAGFVEVSAEGRVSVLTERALRSDEIDVDAARRELTDAQSAAKASSAPVGSAERTVLEQQLDWLEAQLRAAAH